jgi:hypothetical protein
MANPSHDLNSITIASPCQVAWEGMDGDEQIRFCARCSRQVFDLSLLSTAEVTKLLDDEGGTPCVRLHRRSDGRVMTADGPVDVRDAILRRLRRHAAWAASLFALLFFPGCRSFVTQGFPVRHIEPPPTAPRADAEKPEPPTNQIEHDWGAREQ